MGRGSKTSGKKPKLWLWIALAVIVFVAVRGSISMDNKDSGKTLTTAAVQSAVTTTATAESKTKVQEQSAQSVDDSGYGTVSTDGGTYSGQVSNGLPDGYGILTHQDGTHDIGLFDNGIFLYESFLPRETGEYIFRDHYYIENNNTRILSGNILLYTIFADEPGNVFDAEAEESFLSGMNAGTETLLKDASGYGVSLNISIEPVHVTVASELVRDEADEWKKDILTSLGLPEDIGDACDYLKDACGAGEAVLLFIVKQDARSFAKGRAIVLYNGAEDYRHELFHVFGAYDFYYPDTIKELAMNYFPESPMINGSNPNADPLTAYLCGWSDFTPDLCRFLLDTDWITEEYIDEARAYSQLTGYAENYKRSNGLYTGYLENGVPEGYGRMEYNNGDCYEGYWVYGSREGYGVLTDASGNVYTGNWSNNKKNGYGVLQYADGDRYEGNWVDGVRSGQGTYTWAGGDCYEGEWVDGKRTGYGKYTWASGKSWEGQFEDGKRIE